MVDVAADRSSYVTRYEPRFLEALADFYRDIWDPAATPESVARARAAEALRNVAEPGQEVPTYLFIQHDRVIGHLSTIPVRLRAAAADRPAYWLIGFMVRPEHRNGPVGFLLLKQAVRELEVLLSLTVQQATVRLMTAVGFRELGLLPNHVRPLRPGRMLAHLDGEALGLTGLPTAARTALHVARWPVVSQLTGGLARLGLAGWAALASPSRGGLRSTALSEVPGPAADRLWAECRDTLGCAAGRDSAYLRWRYDVGPDGHYRCAAVTEGDLLRGIAFVRAPRAEGDARLRGIRVATLSDLVYDPTRLDVAAALIARAEDVARSLGADALLASGSHRTLKPLLRRRGFVRFGGNLRLLVRDATGALPGATTLGDWWALRGDMNSDTTF